jgi:hypothetical protein
MNDIENDKSEIMRQEVIIGLFFLLLSITSLSQDRKDIVQLNYVSKLHGIRRVPFNTVTVIDNRFDTTKLLVLADGTLPFHELAFVQPASLAIASYIQRVVDPLLKTDRRLYIDLKQFRFGNIATRIGAGQANNVFHKNDPPIKYCLFFSASAYFSTGDHQYKKVFSFKKATVLQIKGFRGDFYQRTVIKALSDFVTALCITDIRAYSWDSAVYDEGRIRTNVIADWASYPINQQTPSANCIYPTFDDFLNSRPRVVDLSLRMAADSTYSLNIPTGVKSPWGAYYEGVFYFGLDAPHTASTQHDRFFLPLVSRNSTFYFYLPHSLPNMYAMLSIGSMATQDILDNSGSVQTNTYADLGALAIGAIFGVRENRVIKDKREKIALGGRGGDLRQCFLDMDSGDVVYY